jgi:DnaJ-class molecular chaperone
MKNYYIVLGIPNVASEIEIKKAYRKGAMFWHPDKNQSLNAKEKFIEIQEAYEVLIDIEKRKFYDSLLNAQQYKPESTFKEKADDRSNNQQQRPPSQNQSHQRDYQKFEDWLNEIRKKAERKASMPFVDDILTESFHFLDKYGWLIVLIFLGAVMIFALSIKK